MSKEGPFIHRSILIWLLRLAVLALVFAAGFWFRRSDVYVAMRGTMAPPKPPGIKEITPDVHSAWRTLPDTPVTSHEVTAMVELLRNHQKAWKEQLPPVSVTDKRQFQTLLSDAAKAKSNSFPTTTSGHGLRFHDSSLFVGNLNDSGEWQVQAEAVKHLRQWLLQHDVQLLPVFIPNPIALHAHEIIPSIPEGADMQPVCTQVVDHLLSEGIPAVDLRWTLSQPAHRRLPAFDFHNHVWNALGIQAGARSVEECLDGLLLMRQADDLRQPMTTRLKALGDWKDPGTPVVSVVEVDGNPIPEDRHSPIIVLGDCHLWINGADFHHSASGDITSHLAAFVGLPLYRVWRFYWGAEQTLVQEMGSGTISRPRLVVWFISSTIVGSDWSKTRDMDFDSIYRAARTKSRLVAPEAASLNASGEQMLTIQILSAPELQKAAESPYPNVLAILEAKEVSSERPLSLLTTVKLNGKLQQRIRPAAGQTWQVRARPWDARISQHPEMARWQQLGTETDFNAERLWVEEFRSLQ